MSLSKVYEALKSNEKLKDKLVIDGSNKIIEIEFNEYLHLRISNDVIVLNDDLTHWHPDDEEDILQNLTDIANGDVIFIEDKRWFSFKKIDVIYKEIFKKKKEKYFAKKHLRIYTGNSIIKPNGLVRHRKQWEHANVGLYISKPNIIYAIPCGWDRITQKAVNTTYIDMLFILNPPYTDDDVEAFLLNALDNCFLKEKEPGPGALEKHFGVNSWFKAVKGLKYVSFSWERKEGYRFMPTIKTPRQGYSPQMDKWIHIEANPQNGELTKALFKAINESTC